MRRGEKTGKERKRQDERTGNEKREEMKAREKREGEGRR